MNLVVITEILLHFRPYFQSDNELRCDKGSNYSVFHSQDFIKCDTKNFVGCGYLTIIPCNLQRIMVAGYEVSQTWLILHCVHNDSEYMPVLPFYYWDSISRLFMVVNSSINFLVYCTGSDQFKVNCNFFAIKKLKKKSI